MAVTTSTGRVLCTLLFVFCVALGNPGPKGCETVLAEFSSKGFQTSNISTTTKQGDLCGADSCCGTPFEEELAFSSKQQLNKFTKMSIERVVSQLENRAKRFDDFFREMMQKSKKEFHTMFERTYGTIYLRNSQVFMDLFAELEGYYSKGNVKLSETMDNFFSVLYQKMFTVINAQYQFNSKYLGCVAEHMVNLKPFGDVPQKLGMQLKRSFVATRTFYKSLIQGGQIAQNMLKIRHSQECGENLAKMQHCGLCKNLQGSGSCFGYCKEVSNSCLRHYAHLGKQWDEFIEAIDKVGDRLLGPFNIEMVVEPINIKISEAIMNFQENGAEVSQKVFAGCGNPQLEQKAKRRRRRRGAQEARSIPLSAKDEISFEPLSFQNGNKKKHSKKVDATPTLDKLIKEIKVKVKETKQFWFYLPIQYCNNLKSLAPSGEPCWNGTNLSNGYEPEPPTETTPPPNSPSVLSEQIFNLQVWTGKLQSAYQGQEVDLADDSEETIYGSGSGSGDDDFEEEEEVFTRKSIASETEKPAVNGKEEEKEEEEEREEDNSIDRSNVIESKSSAASDVSLQKALLTYLLPIVLVWFGSTFADIL